MADREFKHESLQDREAVAAYLRALVEGIEQGSLTLCQGESTTVLSPHGLIRFQVEAREKEGTHRLSVKLTWKDRTVETPPQTLVIQVGS